MFEGAPVEHTAEFTRILNIPRRTLGDGVDLARRLTDVLRKEGGGMTLRPVQALALYEAARIGGLFAPIRVGGGKTLLSLLLPTVLEAKKPLLLLPAALVGKTNTERQKLSTHWRIQDGVRIFSYERLSMMSSAKELQIFRPDLIICDEVHRIKNRRAGVTKRVVAYMRDNPATMFVGMSGTIMSKSVKEFAHLLRWALRLNAPIPLSEGETEEWADVLDEQTGFQIRTPNPGALTLLATPAERDTLDPRVAARRGFARRLTETEGVVSTDTEQVKCSLYVRQLRYGVNSVTETNFKTLRTLAERPDGWALSQATELAAVAKQLALGLHYRWDPEPPKEWLEARKNWAKFCREILKHSRTCDTELQVKHACYDGRHERAILDLWEAAYPTFKVNSTETWHDDSALVACETWMKKNVGIVWTEHTLFAQELSRRTNTPYYGQGGVNAQGSPIEAESGKTCIIASQGSNATGRNLQMFSANLITSCSGSSALWEQLVGRTHRDGQKADEVTVDVLIGCFEHVEGLRRALARAQATQDTLGAGQKLLVADIDWPTEHEVCGHGHLWKEPELKEIA